MKKITSSAILLTTLFFIGCQKDLNVKEPVQPSQPIDESHYYEPSKELLASYDALRNPSALGTRAACDWIEIPAGSTDALAQAINNACAGGVIYLKTGVHTETKPITITKSVNIIGAAGAVLKLNAALDTGTTGAITLKPAIHILNAPNTALLDLDIQPTETDGGTAILFENSNQSCVLRCKFTKFQFSVMIEKSDRMVVLKNTIVVSSLWQTGKIGNAFGIVVINGKSGYIAENIVSNAIFGIWPCDQWGTCTQNTVTENLIGIILCNVPMGVFLPNGKVIGSLVPSTGWKTRNNKATDNQWGYLIIDGANNNIIENNEAARNAAYDMELTTDSYRFGFLTPMSYDNTVNVGSYPNIRIKDCGRNNKVTGGIKVNTTTDPCN